MDDAARLRLAERIQQESELPYCSVGGVAVTLEWALTPTGALSGRLIVRNTSDRVGRVGGKPSLAPLGLDGERLPTRFIVTCELRMPSWVVLAPGARAAAGVSWSGWCGDPASGLVHVRWEQGEATVMAEGPRQPECPAEGLATNLSSTWFKLID